MDEHGQGGKWIAPEDVPDPIALRGHSTQRVRASSPPPATLDLGTLDPLEPPSLEVVQVARTAESRHVPEPAEPTDFTLEPTPPPAWHVDDLEVVVPPRRQLPAAAWVGGSLLLVAVLSMGLRIFTAGTSVPAAQPPVSAPPAIRAAVEPPADPVPVEAARISRETKPALLPLRDRRAEETPGPAAARPTSNAAPPTATIRPLSPPAAASLEPDASPVNPWSEVEP